MHRKRRNLPERALVQLRRVDKIGAGYPNFGRPWIIISRRGSFSSLRRNFLYAIWQAGQAAEQAGHFAVDDLGHPRDLLHQLLWRFGIILRVGTQMFDKGFAAGIACLFCDIDHFGANA